MTNNYKAANILWYCFIDCLRLLVAAPIHCAPTQISNRSPSAQRMSRLRERRKLGYRCLLIEVHPIDVEKLARRGFLDRLHRDDPAAVKTAIERMLEAL